MIGVDKVEVARLAVINTYNKQGNQYDLNDILEGKYDDTFVIRAIQEALEIIDYGSSRAA